MTPGDVLELPDHIGEIPAGMWVVTEIGWMITLHRLGENEDGDLCTLHTSVKVTHEEFRQLVATGLNIFTPSPTEE